MRAHLLWILLTCLMGSGQVVRAAEDKPIHAMIVFDVSGSMRQSDPERSSVAAAQLFSDLARAEDAVGLATFSGVAETLVPVTVSSDSRTKASLQARLRSLQFTGATTNLVAALEAGLASFPHAEHAAHKNLVLLLTDGQLDLGKHREPEESAALEQITRSLLPEYRRRGIALYTIAFTKAADHVLLKQMADASGGEFRFIADATTLHQAFGQIFIGGHQAESFPLEQNRMLVDSSIQDLSLVFEKSNPSERIVLVTPGKETMHSGGSHPGTVWRSTPTYDLVNLRRPQSGEWQIERSGDTSKGVGIIAASTTSLKTEIDPGFIEIGAKATFRAFLLDESVSGGAIKHEAGQTMTAEISTPQGNKSGLALVPRSDGSFLATTPALQAAGKYSVAVTATTPTMKRQRTTTFVVHPECLQASVAGGVPVTASVALSDACPAFKSLAIEAEYTAADRSMQRMALRASREGFYETPIPALTGKQAGRVLVHIRGERAEGRFTLAKGPWPLPTAPPPAAQPRSPDKDSPPVVASVVNKVLVFNGLLLLLGGIGYGAYRYGLWKAKVHYGRSPDLDPDNDR